jgi:hypothetical protein
MASKQTNFKDVMPMVNELHRWHASGSIGSLDSIDVSQRAKLAKTPAIWSIGMPIDSLAYFTHQT